MKSSTFFASVLLLILFAVASAFCFPQADDYPYAVKAIHQGFAATQVSEYTGWNGRYLATALLTASPLTWGTLVSYRLVPVFLILGLWLSLAALLFSLKGALSLDPWRWSALFTALFVVTCPDVAQAFYWYAASMTYTLPLIFVNLALACYFLNIARALKLILISILIVAIVGCDETIMMMVDYTLAFAIAVKFWRARRIDWLLLSLLAVAVASSLVVVVAPGNTVRSGFFEHRHKVIRTLGNLIQFTAMYPFKFVSVSLLAIFVGYFTFFKTSAQTYIERFREHRYVILAFWLGLTTVGCFPSSWAMGGPPNSRTRDLICYFFVMGLIPVALLFVRELKFRGRQIYLPAVATAALLLCSMNTFHLSEGYASRFVKYDQNWQKLIAGEKDTMVEAEKPQTIYFDDINQVGDMLAEFKNLRPEFFGSH